MRFRLELVLHVGTERDKDRPSGKQRRKNANSGTGNQGGAKSHLNLPNIIRVHRDKWREHGFTESSALKVVHAGDSEDSSAPIYDFYVNLDNKYLLHSYKQRGADAPLLEKQFIYGLVLVGLALLQDHHRRAKLKQADGENVADLVARTTSSLGPILLPMLQTIGSLSAETLN